LDAPTKLQCLLLNQELFPLSKQALENDYENLYHTIYQKMQTQLQQQKEQDSENDWDFEFTKDEREEYKG
jgi:hypothetical protein